MAFESRLNSRTIIETVQEEDFWTKLVGFTTQYFSAARCGNQIFFYANLKIDDAISDTAILASIKEDFRIVKNYAIVAVRAVGAGAYPEIATAWIYTNGDFRVYGEINAATNIFIQGGYMIHD